MNSTPLVSIIMPCYEQGVFLEETLQSIQNQTYSHWECLIIDDGSTDKTQEIAKKWSKSDPRYNYYFKDNGGVSSARNFGLEKAQGDYIQFLDADDLINPTKLSYSLKLLRENNHIDLVISNFRMFTVESNKTLDPYCNLKQELFNLKNLLYEWNESFSIPIHCGFFRRYVFDDIQFSQKLTAQEDWLVWVEIFKKKKQAFFWDEPQALYRINPKSRMFSRSMVGDQIIAFKLLREVVTKEEYQKLSEVLISRYMRKSESYRKELINLQQKKYVVFGKFIRRIFAKFGLGTWAKKYLP